jgi:hypothetical protein
VGRCEGIDEKDQKFLLKYIKRKYHLGDLNIDRRLLK